MRDLQLVIFDCDGVLVDSIVLACDLLAVMLTEEGLPTTTVQSLRHYKELLLADVVDIAERELGRALPGDWLERYEARRAEAFRLKLTAVPGAAEAVRGVSAAGVHVCVASQGKVEKTRLSLALTGLDGLFPSDALFSAYDVPRGKPHPDVFLHAAAAMAAEPSRVAVVEDTPSGVTGAVAAGMRAFGYAAASDERALRHAGAEIIRSLDRLPEFLGLPASIS
jgi:HAD superfamily hydrolase (TIGR01509 family)